MELFANILNTNRQSTKKRKLNLGAGSCFGISKIPSIEQD